MKKFLWKKIVPEIFQNNLPKITVMTKKTGKSRRVQKRFLGVDVFRKEFGQVSVRAVFDIFAQKFNIPVSEMKNYSFPHCVEELRQLKKPNYSLSDLR